MYKVKFGKTAAKQARKRREKFKEKINEIGRQLSKNPKSIKAEKLKKPLNFIYSHHFSFKGTAYRLAFTIDKTNKLINIVLLSPRENFYKKLRRIIL